MAAERRPSPLTPQQRLALSRRALVRQLNDDAGAPAEGDGQNDLEYAYGSEASQAAATPDDPRHGHSPRKRRRDENMWLAVGRSVVERWWRRHPAHAVGQLARPVLEHYAHKEPAKLMAAAAATGAVLVLVKPWRLLSATAVVAAVLKTSDVADLINTLMRRPPPPP
ncbi:MULTISPECIES: hypothetical protein [unclassified Variovorax]|jgi:hypothetical protein|uniref:hypothetical protein n=1 Tax=unclassified Variovorax TaxID=663243 RepID=UPI000F7FA772|nr:MULTISPECIES: hypothetical protein [unclassified Variovorax]RSZ47128.1 hypothetical protein EJO70_00445 [Variovorax sp. 553]RSZ48750.1 hypothetical protein EJO71_03525 [Variovorax sp. 679]